MSHVSSFEFLVGLAVLIVSFAVYAIGGWVWEELYALFVRHRFERRGFLYGPYCPIYAVGAIPVYLFLGWCEDTVVIFLLGMFISTAIEYAVGWSCEEFFHKRFWDYDNMPLNYNGRVCLPASLLFGYFAWLVVAVIQPALNTWFLSWPTLALVTVAIAFLVVIAYDSLLSIRRWGTDTRRVPMSLKRITEVAERVPYPSEIGDGVRKVAMRSGERVGDGLGDAGERIRMQVDDVSGSFRELSDRMRAYVGEADVRHSLRDVQERLVTLSQTVRDAYGRQDERSTSESDIDNFDVGVSDTRDADGKADGDSRGVYTNDTIVRQHIGDDIEESTD